MSLFGLGKAPDGSPFKTAGEHKRFLSLVMQSVKDQKLDLVYDGALGAFVSKTNDRIQFGLANLSQTCAGCPAQAWPEIIDGHMAGVVAASKGQSQTAPEFVDIRDELKIRLFAIDVPPMPFVSYPIAEGFLTVLAQDKPTHVVSVNREMASHWNMSETELYDIALENVWREGRLTFEPHRAESATLRIANGESFFTASHLLMLDRYVLQESSYGLLASAPTRHLAVYHEIVDGSFVDALKAMVNSGAGLFQHGPGSITPHLYWVRGGKWTCLTAVVDGKIAFTPSEEFTRDVLDPLDPYQSTPPVQT